MNSGPLSGVKVIEIAGIGPAPCTGMMLADMGAEVILIERKSAGSNAVAIEQKHVQQLFYNRGKQSIVVDLKQPEGVELVLELINNADVLIEGFRPGVMERLGLGPDICLNRNEKLIYGRMTGWGQTGPLSQAAGHDQNYAALSGALWYGGRKNEAPKAPMTLVGDLGGGTMMLAWGVLCAYINVQNTGKGQVVDTAITDGSAYLSSLLMVLRNTGQLQDDLETGWADGAAPWSDTYQCADGKYITLCSLEPQFYQLFLEKLELMDDPLFQNQWDTKNWPQAKQKVSEIFLQKSQVYWCELLEGTDVCFAPVLNFSEAVNHPHNQARNVFVEQQGVLQPAPAPKLSASVQQVGRVPLPGEHSDSILKNLGLSDDKITVMKEAGVV